MAIIFNISEAIKSSEFNVLGLSIPMLLENQVEEFQRGSKINEVFVNKTLDGYSQSYHTSVSHGGFRPSEDMEIAKLHDWEDSYGKTFIAQTWKDSFAISEEAREDNRSLEINSKVREFATNYARTREQYCAATVAGALTKSFTYGGKKFPLSAIDSVDGEIDGAKQLYFNRYHYTSVKVTDANDFVEMNGYEPWTNAGTGDTTAPNNTVVAGVWATPPQSNKFLVYGGKLDADGHAMDKGLNLLKLNPVEGDTADNIAVYDQIRFVLDTIREYGANHRDYDGKLVPLHYDKIVMPSNAKLSKAIKAALGASATEGPFDGPMKGDQYQLVEWAYLNGKPGFTNKEMGMVIMDSARNNSELGFILWDRKPLTVTSYIQDGNNTMVWYGRARFRTDTCDPYAAVYVAFGDLENLTAQAYSGTTTTKYAKGEAATKQITDSNALFIDLSTFEISVNPTVYTGVVVNDGG